MSFPQLEDLPDIDGKRVLVRTDFNVPMSDGEIADDLRIRSALPTLRWLQDRGAHITAMTHFGRPKGEPNPEFAIAPVQQRVDELLPGVDLMENLRFDPGETSNDPDFVQRLIAGQDFYVNEAFGVAHRAHASVVGPPQFLPSAAGRLLANEIEILSEVRDNARRPFVAIMGGAKVSDKVAIIDCLAERVDTLLIGGAMAFTFFKAMGRNVGCSLVEDSMVDYARCLLEETDKNIVLPTDIRAIGPGGELFKPEVSSKIRHFSQDLPDDWMGVDIGPETAGNFSDIIAEAQTVLWNGPLGVFEDARFEAGTKHIAQAVADSSAFTVIGGGDSASAAKQFGVAEKIDHVSTGGGAALELLEKGDLPGLRALRGEYDS